MNHKTIWQLIALEVKKEEIIRFLWSLEIKKLCIDGESLLVGSIEIKKMLKM